MSYLLSLTLHFSKGEDLSSLDLFGQCFLVLQVVLLLSGSFSQLAFAGDAIPIKYASGFVTVAFIIFSPN